MLFALAFVNALLYIIQYKTLKKNFNQKYFRIGSVATLEKLYFFQLWAFSNINIECNFNCSMGNLCGWYSNI